MTPDELKKAADEMVEVFKNFFRGYGISFDYDGWQLYKNEVNKQSTRIAIAHCKRVIEVIMDIHSQMWGMPDAVRVTENEINNHRLILSELEGRVK